MNTLVLENSHNNKREALKRGFLWLQKTVVEIIGRHRGDSPISTESIRSIDEICGQVIDHVTKHPDTNIREMLEMISSDGKLGRPLTREEKHNIAQLVYLIQQKISAYGAVKNATKGLGVRKVRAI